MKDLVVVSLEPWDEVWRRNQHLLAGLLRGRSVSRVLFVEPAADPAHTLRRRERPRLGTGLRRITDVADVLPDRLWAYQPTKWLPRRLDRSVDARWANHTLRAASSLRMTDPVLWVNDPLGAELVKLTSWPCLYDITDDWLAANRPDAEIARLRRQEAALLAAAEEVIVCSPALHEAKSTLRDVVLIPNAVDVAAYRTLGPRPNDLPSGRVALYLGTAHRDRIDVDLLVECAHTLQSGAGGTVVLVGPTPLPRRDLDRLDLAGVRVLGPRPSDTVPAYLQHADVLIVPHVSTKFTASLDPIKAYEYRAARRPVVSTPVPGFVGVADPLVRAVRPRDFAEAVAANICQPVPWTPDMPGDIPSWAQRVAAMAAVIDRVERGRS